MARDFENCWWIFLFFFLLNFNSVKGKKGALTPSLLIYVLLNILVQFYTWGDPLWWSGAESWQVWWTCFVEKAYHIIEWQRKGHLNSCYWGNKTKLFDARQQLYSSVVFIGTDDESFREAIQSYCNESAWCCNFIVCMASFKLLIFYRYSKKLEIYLHLHFYAY